MNKSGFGFTVVLISPMAIDLGVIEVLQLPRWQSRKIAASSLPAHLFWDIPTDRAAGFCCLLSRLVSCEL